MSGSRARRDERGGVAVIVAALFAGSLVLALLALTIDAGAAFVERRELQNSSDATARALARACATTPSTCAGWTGTQAVSALRLTSLAGSNYLLDKRTAIAGVCDRRASSAMPDCASAATSPAPDALRDCMPLATAMRAGGSMARVPYVEVRTLTDTPRAGGVLHGIVSGRDTRLTACSRVAWGSSMRATVLPVVASECAWQQATGWTPTRPAEFGTATAPHPAHGEVVIYTKDAKGNTGCSTSPSGGYAPGGFAALEESSTTDCQAEDVEPGWLNGNPGNDRFCNPTTLASSYVGRVVYVPVFTAVQGTGSNVQYEAYQFAAFYLSGFRMSGASVKSTYSGKVPCSNPDRCISGWFVTDVNDSGVIAPIPANSPTYGLLTVVGAG